MEILIKLDVKIRNISLVIISITVLIPIIWVLVYLDSPKKELQYLLNIGIALFLAGVLILTRIQFVLWAQKRMRKS